MVQRCQRAMCTKNMTLKCNRESMLAKVGEDEKLLVCVALASSAQVFVTQPAQALLETSCKVKA